jgi:GNAT superfamily N-acetyltransferase
VSKAWRARLYEPSDLSSVIRLLTTAFASASSDSVRFSVSASNTAAFVAEVSGAVVGVGMGISFGGTGWVGSVVVSPEHQRCGIGSALTERAVEYVLNDSETVFLLALEPARRIYEGLGFVADGLYGTWVLPSGDQRNPSWAPSMREMATMRTEAVFEQCAALDQRATGEDRRIYLEPLEASMTAISSVTGSHGDETVTGYGAQLSWGVGPIISEDPDVGSLLVRRLLAMNPRSRIEFPDANEAGLELVRELGMVRVDDDLRMRLGPPFPAFRPECVYKVLTPAVG